MIHTLYKSDQLPAQGFEDVDRFMRERFDVDVQEFVKSWRVREVLRVTRSPHEMHLCATDDVLPRNLSHVVGVVWMSNNDVRRVVGKAHNDSVITGEDVEVARKAILASIKRLDAAFQASRA